jgi:hypothetical protein
MRGEGLKMLTSPNASVTREQVWTLGPEPE